MNKLRLKHSKIHFIQKLKFLIRAVLFFQYGIFYGTYLFSFNKRRCLYEKGSIYFGRRIKS